MKLLPLERKSWPQRCFFRVLFGDTRMDRYDRILAEVVASKREPLQPAPLIVAAFGQKNYDFLVSQGFNAFMVADEGVFDFCGKEERNANIRGTQNYGCNLFLHKIYALYAITKHAPEVAFMDWDCFVSQPFDETWWSDRRQGPIVQVILAQYHNVCCGWRKTDRRKIAETSMLYVRDAAFMERVYKNHLANPLWSCQTAISYTIDQDNGEWVGVEGWAARGYELLTHRIAGIEHVYPRTGTTMFTTRKSHTSPLKSRFEKRWRKWTEEEARQAILNRYPDMSPEELERCIKTLS